MSIDLSFFQPTLAEAQIMVLCGIGSIVGFFLQRYFWRRIPNPDPKPGGPDEDIGFGVLWLMCLMACLGTFFVALAHFIAACWHGG